MAKLCSVNEFDTADAQADRPSRIAIEDLGSALHPIRLGSHGAIGRRKLSRRGVCVFAFASALVSLLTLTGCSTDLVIRDTDSPANPAASPTLTAGFSYKLPMIAFDITSSWSLISCDATFARVILEDEQGFAPDKSKLPNVRFKVSTTVAPTYIADDARLFIVDYPATNSTFAKTDIKVEQYGNGTLKSINAHVTGEGPAIAASLIDTASQIAGTFLHAALTGQAKSLHSAPAGTLCTPETRLKIAARTKHQTEYEKLREQALTVTSAKLADLNSQLDAYKAQLQEDNAGLTYTKTLRWIPDDFGAFHQGVEGGKDGWNVRRNQFLSLHKIIGEMRMDPSTMGWFDKDAVSAMEPYAKLALILDGGFAGPERPISADGKTRYPDSPSFDYRLPIQSKLMICMNVCGGSPPSPELFSNWYLIPQNGPMFTVPLHNGPFDDNTITAEFAESGVPTSLGFVAESSLKKAAAAVDTAATAAATAAGQSQTKELRDLNQKTAVLEAKKKYLDAQKALRDAQ